MGTGCRQTELIGSDFSLRRLPCTGKVSGEENRKAFCVVVSVITAVALTTIFRLCTFIRESVVDPSKRADRATYHAPYNGRNWWRADAARPPFLSLMSPRSPPHIRSHCRPSPRVSTEFLASLRSNAIAADPRLPAA
jgi:hypothetical protein